VNEDPPVLDPAAVRARVGEVRDGPIPLGELPVEDDQSPHLVVVRGNGRPTDPARDSVLSRFRLIPDGELATLEPPSWLITNYLTEGGFSVLYGPPGAGKSFLALDWAFSVARGIPWQGTATRRGSVVFVAAESGYGVGRRIAAYRAQHDVQGTTGLNLLTDGVRLLEPGDVVAFLAALDEQLRDPLIDELVQPGVIIFDTFARALVGGDENSAKDVGLAIAAADAIRRRTTAHVLFIHHTQKAGELERGSSALRGAADTMFSLTNDGTTLTLEVTKQKDALAAPVRQLRLVPAHGSCIVEPETRDASTRPLTKSERHALHVLATAALDSPITASAWWEGAEMKRRTFYDARARLVSLGAVEKQGRGYVVSLTGRALCD